MKHFHVLLSVVVLAILPLAVLGSTTHLRGLQQAEQQQQNATTQQQRGGRPPANVTSPAMNETRAGERDNATVRVNETDKHGGCGGYGCGGGGSYGGGYYGRGCGYGGGCGRGYGYGWRHLEAQQQNVSGERAGNASVGPAGMNQTANATRMGGPGAQNATTVPVNQTDAAKSHWHGHHHHHQGHHHHHGRKLTHHGGHDNMDKTHGCRSGGSGGWGGWGGSGCGSRWGGAGEGGGHGVGGEGGGGPHGGA